MTARNTVDAINCILYRKSVALSATQPNTNKLNGRPFHFIRRNKFEDRAYRVSPRYEKIRGVNFYLDIAILTEAPDMVIVAIASVQCEDVVTKPDPKGCLVAIIFSSGFGEIKNVSFKMEQQLLHAAPQSRIRFCGLNNLGFVNSFNKLSATSNQYSDQIPISNLVAFATRFGAFSIGFTALARNGGIGIGYFVNTGNQVDISLMDVLEVAIDAECIKFVAAYLGWFCKGDTLICLVNKGMSFGKPLIVTKVRGKATGARNITARWGESL